LDLPIAGAPRQEIELGRSPRRVAVVAADFPGMRPQMRVQLGESVRRGQLLFEEKRAPEIRHTAPAAGTVVAIHRGAQRALLSLVIELSAAERDGDGSGAEQAAFSSFRPGGAAALGAAGVRALLVESGLWTALRARPFGRVPHPGTEPHALFVTAMDSHPLAADPDVVVRGRESDLAAGLACVATLTQGRVFVCQRPGSALGASCPAGVQVEEFAGPHPAGTPGLHMHMLSPVSRARTAWHLGYQDVLAIGVLARTGRLDPGRVIAFAGPPVRRPRLLRTRLGASLDEIVEGELAEGENRVVSGSVLAGRTAMGQVHGYLGRYHGQVSVLREGRERELLGWLAPGRGKFSVLPLFVSALARRRERAFTTSLHGSVRAILPLGAYERVFPFDIIPTYLLRALAVDDVERAEQLGCLELDEEDLALCTLVCPSKCEFGPMLRRNLDQIEREG